MREPQKDDAQPHKRQSARVARDACRPVPARGKEQEHACGGRSINLGHAQAAEEDEDWEDDEYEDDDEFGRQYNRTISQEAFKLNVPKGINGSGISSIEQT